MESRPYSSHPSLPLQARGTSALLLHQCPWCSTPFSATPVQFRTGKPLLSLCLLVLCLGCRTDPILHFDSHRVGCTIIGSVTLLLGWLHYYQVSCAIIGPIWCAFPPCFCSSPLHALPHHSLRRFNLYLHASLFSSCHCNPGCLSLA